MEKKKKKIICIIAIVTIVGAIVAVSCVSSIKHKKRMAFEIGRLEAMVTVADKAAKEFGLSCELIEYIPISVDTYPDYAVYVKLDGFGTLTPAEMNTFYHYIRKFSAEYEETHWLRTYHFEDDRIGNSMIIKDGDDEFTFDEYSMDKNGSKVASTKFNAYDEDGNEKEFNNSSYKKKCYLCNGTGSVKYYYGSSDLEAYLDGHDASWYGQCGVCGGTGYTD